MARGDIRAGRAYVELFVEQSALVQGLRQAGRKLTSFGADIGRFGAMVTAAGAAIVGPLAGAVRHFMQAGDDLDKMSARTGIAVGTLAELGFAAEQSGSSLAELEPSLRRMTRTIGEARQGSMMYVDALNSIGISIQELDALSPDEHFSRIAQALDQIADPTRKGTAAMQIFGRSATAVIPMLADLEEHAEEARRRGLIPTEASTKAAAELTDLGNTISRMAGTVAYEIGETLAPAIIGIAETIMGAISGVREWIRRNRELVRTVAGVGAAILAAGTAITVFGGAVMALGMFLTAAAKVLGAMAGLFALLTSPVALVTAALVAGTVAWARYTEAGQGAVRLLRGVFGELAQIARDTIGGIWDAIAGGDLELAGEIAMTGLELIARRAAEAMRGIFGDTIANIVQLLLGGDLANALATAGDAMLQVWRNLRTGMIEVFAGIVGAVSAMWADMVSALAGRIMEVAMEDTWRGEMWRKVIGHDPRETAAFTHEGMAHSLEREQAALDEMRRQMESQGYVGTHQDFLAREAAGLPVGADQLAQQEAVVREAEQALRDAGYVPRDEVHDPAQLARDLARRRIEDITDPAHRSLLDMAQEEREIRDELADLRAERLQDDNEAANERIADLEEQLDQLRERAQGVREERDRQRRDDPGMDLPDVAQAARIASVTFSAAAFQAMGGGPDVQERTFREVAMLRRINARQLIEAERLRQRIDRIAPVMGN